MIDLRNEEILTFTELARRLPRRRRGRPVHPATVHRWRLAGVKGVHLEAVRVGGSWVTTWEAFMRFAERLTALEGAPPPGTSRRPSATAEAAGKELERQGV